MLDLSIEDCAATPARPGRRRDKHASKNALMRAGLQIFSERGYDGATTRAIAEQAGLNEQLISRYFGGKAGLLAAIYMDFMETQGNDEKYLQQPLAATPGEEIAHFLRVKHAHFVVTEQHLRILLPQLIIVPDTRLQLDDAVLCKGVRVLAERLERFRERGLLRSDVDVESLSLSVLCQALAVSFLLRTIENINDDVIHQHLTEFARNLAGGVEQADRC